jgi:cyclopropane-fatty-acyl-phospholipid synthase
VSATAARALVRLVLPHVRGGSLTVVDPGGAHRTYGAGAPSATIQLLSDDAWPAFLGGSLALADAYADGLWDSPDLVALIRFAARNMPPLDRLRRLAMPLLRPLDLYRAARRPRGRDQRRRDIAAHYDLGNELFSHMLDPTMTYSCALFTDPQMTLEQAQLAKLERICEKLDIGPEDRVLEIGTGWGSFALYAAATRGCHVTTTTISCEQHAYATERVRQAGLCDRVTILMNDYRDLSGSYDKLVSVEMIEAVGWQNFGGFLAHCSQLLEPDGAMLLQAITIDDRAYEVEKATRSFIKQYIFPGGALPSLAVLTLALARRTDLRMVGVDDIAGHYVETLRRWRIAFAANADALERYGYDERFRRIWLLYLAYCEGGFAERRIAAVQILLSKPSFRVAGAFPLHLVDAALEHVA